MAGSDHYQCGECRYRFRAPEGMAREARLLMCPACGSIDLNVAHADLTPDAFWSARPQVPRGAEGRGATTRRPEVATASSGGRGEGTGPLS